MHGTPRDAVFNTITQGTLSLSFQDITELCKRWASELDEVSGREVYEFVGVSLSLKSHLLIIL